MSYEKFELTSDEAIGVSNLVSEGMTFEIRWTPPGVRWAVALEGKEIFEILGTVTREGSRLVIDGDYEMGLAAALLAADLGQTEVRVEGAAQIPVVDYETWKTENLT